MKMRNRVLCFDRIHHSVVDPDIDNHGRSFAIGNMNVCDLKEVATQ